MLTAATFKATEREESSARCQLLQGHREREHLRRLVVTAAHKRESRVRLVVDGMSEWRDSQSMASRSSGAPKILGIGRRILFRPKGLPTRVVPSMVSTISEVSQNSMSEGPNSLTVDDGQDHPVSTPQLRTLVAPINGPRVIVRRGTRIFAARSPPGAVIIHSGKSTRTLFGPRDPVKRHRCHCKVGRRTVVRMELENGIKLAKRNLFARKPWLDGPSVMVIVVGNTFMSILMAWAAAILYAVGSPFAPVSPEIFIKGATTMTEDSKMSMAKTTQFFGAVGFYFVLFACIAHAVLTAVALSHVASWLKESSAYSLALCSLLVPCRDYSRVHLYAIYTITYGYAIFMERKMCEPRESKQLDSRARPAHLKTKPLQQLSAAMRGGFLPLMSFNIVFAYLHIASALKLTQQWELLVFAVVSLLLKLALQEATKRFQLHHKVVDRSSVRTVHVAMTIPTIAIDAQIRMVFLQNGGDQSIVVSSIAIVSCEVFFRVTKILRLRYLITARLTECKDMQRILKRANSKSALRDIAIARAEYAGFLDWKNFVLRVHAAEVFADMHGEYISIGMSTAIVVCMGDHPMFDLARIQLHNNGSVAGVAHLITAAAFQMGTGLVFDYVSGVVEGVHEVPLYDSVATEGAEFRVLLYVLLSTLTAVNVGIIAVFCVKLFE